MPRACPARVVSNPDREEKYVDIVVTGRHTQVTERFREHLEEKLAKVPQLHPKVSRVDVVITHEKAVRDCEAVEITCHAKGPVIRAEACTNDVYTALDAALEKLYERLRRASDRKRVARAGRRVPESVSHATARTTDGSTARRGSGRRRGRPRTGRRGSAPSTAPSARWASRRSRCARRCTPARR